MIYMNLMSSFLGNDNRAIELYFNFFINKQNKSEKKFMKLFHLQKLALKVSHQFKLHKLIKQSRNL